MQYIKYIQNRKFRWLLSLQVEELHTKARAELAESVCRLPQQRDKNAKVNRAHQTTCKSKHHHSEKIMNAQQSLKEVGHLLGPAFYTRNDR
jgi:hypothetical protein